MDNIKKIETAKADIKIGDTVIWDNMLTTVGRKDIKNCPFMGVSIFGNSERKTITKVLFIVPTNKGIQLR